MKAPSKKCKSCKNYRECVKAALLLFEELTVEVFSE